MLKRITAPHFVAAFEMENGRVSWTHCAPIISYMKGWPINKVRAYCKIRGWRLTNVPRRQL